MSLHNSSSTEGDFITIFQTGSIDPDEHPDLADQLLESRTQVGSETGYMMKFGDHSHSALSLFDFVSLPGQNYPVPQSALESLPAHIVAKLEQDGAIQIVGEYDPDSGRYENAAIAWETQDAIDRIAELLATDGVSVHEAVDWVVVEESERFTPAQWASIREVTEKAVRSNVNTARERILPDEEPDPDE